MVLISLFNWPFIVYLGICVVRNLADGAYMMAIFQIFGLLTVLGWEIGVAVMNRRAAQGGE